MTSRGYNQQIGEASARNVAAVPSPPFQRLKANWREVLRRALDEYASTHPGFTHGGKVSLRKFSLAIGNNPTIIWEWLDKKPSKDPQFSSIAKLMGFLGKPLTALVEEDQNTTTQLMALTPVGVAATAMLVGIVEAGVWRESEALKIEEEIPIPYVPDQRYINLKQVAWRVSGQSINRVAPDGSYLITVRFIDLGRGPRDGEIVICQRSRHGEVESTAKRVKFAGGDIQLVPDSTDPRFQKPVWLKSEEREPGIEVAADHLVIGVYRPLD